MRRSSSMKKIEEIINDRKKAACEWVSACLEIDDDVRRSFETILNTAETRSARRDITDWIYIKMCQLGGAVRRESVAHMFLASGPQVQVEHCSRRYVTCSATRHAKTQPRLSNSYFCLQHFNPSPVFDLLRSTALVWRLINCVTEKNLKSSSHRLGSAFFSFFLLKSSSGGSHTHSR